MLLRPQGLSRTLRRTFLQIPGPRRRQLSLQTTTMTSREFFYLVAQMRTAQKAYFKNRAPHVLRAALKLESEVDKEIERVHAVLANQ